MGSLYDNLVHWLYQRQDVRRAKRDDPERHVCAERRKNVANRRDGAIASRRDNPFRSLGNRLTNALPDRTPGPARRAH